jgi:hypothetical protein
METITCPNCGASAKNHMNCEYCGSMLVRFVDKNISVDLSLTSPNDAQSRHPRLVEELQINLKLQDEYDIVDTEVCDSSGGICYVNFLSPLASMEFSNYGEKALIMSLPVSGGDRAQEERFNLLGIDRLFTTTKIDDGGTTWCEINVGQDYLGAVQLFHIVMDKFYDYGDIKVLPQTTYKNKEDTPPQSSSPKENIIMVGMIIFIVLSILFVIISNA